MTENNFKDKVFYLAQKYRGSEQLSIERAFFVCDQLELEMGLTVYSPIRETHFQHEFRMDRGPVYKGYRTPEYIQKLKKLTESFDYVKRDIALLETFDKSKLIMVFDYSCFDERNNIKWFVSSGALEEYRWALKNNVPCYYVEAIIFKIKDLEEGRVKIDPENQLNEKNVL
jgi:hypothetical protein